MRSTDSYEGLTIQPNLKSRLPLEGQPGVESRGAGLPILGQLRGLLV